MQIVFPEAHWVGTKQENPTEKKLPMPAELQAAVHAKYAFGSDAHQTGDLLSTCTVQSSVSNSCGPSRCIGR